ncbi:Rv3235 family protein [Streptomyces griseorubiginosus]|uniref:Rv3235 family protein n=1 Tax=Streptomyces griseorubiginosus TaxID=67304 RepID=UPI002E81C55E|nr:Rv3235 family protein [Streptomyces griseorubiginosus]WUB46647.1 Rv3235 family protein [Streptomyces griseorubiginosus]WUB55168.1 Rv3235 family protein [Streptomyces griseorubiginosus]
MNKVMTRAQHHSGTRPPARRDSRRPGGTPPRTPGGSTPRTAPGDGRPPGSPGNGTRARTGPVDNRPQSGPGRSGTSPTSRPGTTHGRPTTTVTPATTTGTAADDAGSTTTTSSTPSRATATLTGTPTTRPLPRTAAATAPGTTTHPHPTPDVTPEATPLVPHQTPRRPLVPQPRPTDRFADLLLTVLSGQRPVHSMLRHTAGRAYDELAWLAERGPLRTRGTRPVVRDIGYYVPRAGAVEAFARIGAGDQVRAMAFRLEQGQDLRWRCTAVELGGPRAPRPDDD